MISFPQPFPLRAVINNGVTSVLHGGGTGGGSIVFSAGTLSSALSAITFNNGGGVSFGLNGAGIMTASVAPGAGAGTGFTTGTTAGTNVVGTLGAGGLSMRIPAYLTTAQPPGAYLTTAQPPGAYLTTAMASNRGTDFVQASATFFGTNASGTIASNAISVSVAAAGSGGAGTGFTTATTAGTNIVGTLSTNGLSMGVPAYLTTASIYFAAAGNSNSLTGVLFLNSNNVTFGLSGDIYTASAAVNISAGTTSSNVTQIQFSNGSGVSFGYDGTNVTASVQTNYQSPGAYLTTAQPPGAYLTTAQPVGTYAGTGFTTATTAGTNVVGTLGTNGISMGVPAYLTSAVTASSLPRLDQVLDETVDKQFNFGSLQLQYQWALGGSFSTNATREGMFELDVQGNLTQEADVMHVHHHGGAPTKLDMIHVEADGANVTGLRLQMSASVAGEFNQPIKFTTEDAGYAIGSVPMILGTQMSNSVSNLNAHYLQGALSSQFAGLGFTSASTAGSLVVATLSTNGLSMGIPSYLTTAAAAGITNIRMSAGTASTLASAFTFSNANSITFGLGTGASAGVITASFGNDVDTQWAGTNTSVVTTGGSDLSFAANSSGITIAYPKWLTVAAGGGGVALSNSQTLFSNGTVALSEGGGAITIASSAGGQSFMFSVPQTSSVVGSGMISIGTAGSTINISAPNTSSIVGVGVMSVSTNVSTISILAPATSSLVGAGGISISTNGSTITISYSSSNTSAPSLGYFENMPFFPVNTTTVSASGSVLQIVPFILPQPASIAFIRIPASFSFVSTSAAGTTANTSFTQNRSYTVAAVIYSNAGGNMSQIGSLISSYASYVFQTSITAGNTGSQYTLWNNVTYPVSGNYGNYATSVGFTNVSYQNSTGSLTLFTGLRWLDIPFKTSLSAGNYWLGIGCSNATATNAGPALTGASMNPISMYAQSQTNLTFIRPGEASNSSVQVQPGLGSFSTNASLFSLNTVPMTAISMQVSNPKLYFQMIWST